MSKGINKLQKIIENGSLKQRLRLYMNHVFSQRDTRELTPELEEALIKSFDTNEEKRALRDLDEKISNLRKNHGYIEILQREYLIEVQKLEGLANTLTVYEETEDVINTIFHEINDLEKQKEIVEKVKNTKLKLAQLEESEDKGYIEIRTREYSPQKLEEKKIEDGGFRKIKVEDAIYSTQTSVREKLSNFKGAIQAQREILEKENLPIKSLKEAYQEMEKLAQNYSTSSYEYHNSRLELIPNSNPNVQEHLKKFSIFPKYEEIEADEEQYNTVWKVFKEGGI